MRCRVPFTNHSIPVYTTLLPARRKKFLLSRCAILHAGVLLLLFLKPLIQLATVRYFRLPRLSADWDPPKSPFYVVNPCLHARTHLIFRLSLGFLLPLQLLQELVLLLLADAKLFLQRLKFHLCLHFQLRVLVLHLLRFCSQ